MKNAIILLAVLTVSIASCTSNTPKTLKGVVVDATMNTVLVKDGTDTLSFSTMDAERVCPTGMLLGDSIEVVYNGKLEKGLAGANVATKISTTPQFLGAWVQPIPGMEGEQGFVLNGDGTASSINMATLLYKSWKYENGMLLLSGESLGNGVTINFVDTASFVAPIDTLNLVSNGYANPFTRQK